MNIILLSGGSGKRLWPLSNDTRSKQFLKLLKNENGEFESMVQRVHGQIKKAGINANIVIATGASQVDSIRSQVGWNVDIVLEPERRDTFPAIALSCGYLALVKKIDYSEPVLVLPVDPYAEMEYFHTMKLIEAAVKLNKTDLVLMGIKPSYPSEKYGYIIPESNYEELEEQLYVEGSGVTSVYQVRHFVEKPSKTEAENLIAEGAVWNGGVFGFRLGYLMNIVNQYAMAAGVNVTSFADLESNYKIFHKISFDYEVVEKAASISMIPYNGKWKDLGTWNTLSEQMEEACIGFVKMDDESENTNVINELSIPIVTLGVKDLIVAASPDGILVSDKKKSSALKTYVDGLNERPMYEERTWGEYKALDLVHFQDGTRSLTKHITIKAGQSIGYQAHYKRNEIWTIINGNGKLIMEGMISNMSVGEIAYIQKGQKYNIIADDGSDLHCIVVQTGMDLMENDVEFFDLVYS